MHNHCVYKSYHAQKIEIFVHRSFPMLKNVLDLSKEYVPQLYNKSILENNPKKHDYFVKFLQSST